MAIFLPNIAIYLAIIFYISSTPILVVYILVKLMSFIKKNY